MTIEGTIVDFQVTRKEKKLEERADEKVWDIEKEEICADCGKDLKFEKVEHWYDDGKDEVLNVCSDCWSMRRQMKRDISGKGGEGYKPSIEGETKFKKMDTKWKIILAVLCIGACLTILFLIDKLFNIF